MSVGRVGAPRGARAELRRRRPRDGVMAGETPRRSYLTPHLVSRIHYRDITLFFFNGLLKMIRYCLSFFFQNFQLQDIANPLMNTSFYLHFKSLNFHLVCIQISKTFNPEQKTALCQTQMVWSRQLLDFSFQIGKLTNV